MSLFAKLKMSLMVVLVLGAMASVANSQLTIVNYDFNAGTTPTTYFGVTSSVSSGQVLGNTNPGVATTGTAFTANATAGNALTIPDANQAGTNYFQFNVGGTFLTSYFGYRIYVQANPVVSAAPNTLTLSYQPGCAGAYTDLATTLALPGINVWTAGVFDVSGVVALNNQATNCFRLTGSGTSGANKTLAIDNFQIQASIVAASSVAIGGRVTTYEGYSISRARVSLVDGNGVIRYASTNPFGYYRFTDVAGGSTYVLSVRSKQYEFAEPTQVISATGDLSDVNFVALPALQDFASPRIFLGIIE